MNKLTQPVTVLKGIGKQKAAELHQLSIDTVEDLLTHYPYRYEDRANLKPISQLSSDQLETVLGRVYQKRSSYAARNACQQFRKNRFNVVQSAIFKTTLCAQPAFDCQRQNSFRHN